MTGDGPASGSAPARPPPPPHLHALDLMRVVAVTGVVAVHVVSLTNRSQALGVGAVTILLHTSREVFVIITALVLAYRPAASGYRPLQHFWARRYWLVLAPYLVWSLAYFLADGEPLSPLPEAAQKIGVDLVTGGARYHLYFLLVTLQLYLVFPLVLRTIRATRGHHLALLLFSLGLQLSFTAAIHYRWGTPPLLTGWLSNPDALLPSYQLYVVVGALMADHLDQLTRWVRGHGRPVALAVLLVGAAGVGSYLADVGWVHLPPLRAGQVFQPAVTLESLAAILGMYALGVVWAERHHPGRLARLVGEGAAVSFGVYLIHPLVLQGLLLLGTVTGLLNAGLMAPVGLTVAVGLLAVAPAVLVISWTLVKLARHSHLSVPLTGKPAQPLNRPPPAVRAHRRWLKRATIGVAVAGLVLIVAEVRFSSGDLAVVREPGSDVPSPVRTAAPAGRAEEAPPTGANMSWQTIDVGGISRSFLMIRPDHPATSLQALVVLHGIGASVEEEEQRDGFLPLVSAGRLLLVYPVGYEQSWNAGSCCGAAQFDDIDDVAFLTDLIHRVAGLRGVEGRRIVVAGFSNGGKMAYRLVCERPRLAAALVMVAALPSSSCRPGPPVSRLQVASSTDPLISDPQVRSEVAAWRLRDHCGPASIKRKAGQLVIERWPHCRRSMVELATYASSDHVWPEGGNGTPSTADVVWEFIDIQPHHT